MQDWTDAPTGLGGEQALQERSRSFLFDFGDRPCGVFANEPGRMMAIAPQQRKTRSINRGNGGFAERSQYEYVSFVFQGGPENCTAHLAATECFDGLETHEWRFMPDV